MTVKVAAKTTTKDALTGDSVLTATEIALVDEAATLNKEVEDSEVKPKIKRIDEIKKVLVAVALDAKRFPLDKPAKLVGNEGVVEFKEQSHPREITNMDAAIQALKQRLGGYEKMIEAGVIKINLGDLDKYLTEAEMADFVKPTDGSRTIKSIRLKD